jgi:hypothetical protein
MIPVEPFKPFIKTKNVQECIGKQKVLRIWKESHMSQGLRLDQVLA